MKSAASRIVLLLVGLFFIAEPAWAIIDSTLQMQLGNPSGATADTNNHDHYLIQRPIESIDYNDTKGLPNWASWDLTAADANNAVARQDSFAADTNLPPNFHWVGPNDYSGSGYDRGHLCPSADRTDSTNHNDQTFLMDNMMPQASDNNSGVWNNFESYCRNYAVSSNYEVLIICGPSGFSGAKINTNGYVWIPSFTWKIAVFVPPGSGTATNRITSNTRVITIKVPNTNGVSSVWQNFVTSANQIQVDTGLTFFTALAPDIAAVLRAKVDGQTNPPPVIYAFTPATGAAGTNVVITGTNFTGASQVAFNGVTAPFTINSNTQITATVPTNASSGSVSVSTASGTAISTNSFTFIGSSGGTVYSGILAGWDVSTCANYGPTTFAATTNAANLLVAGLTRASGMRTNNGGAARGWGGVNFSNATLVSAVSSNVFATFSLTVSNGYTLSFSSVSRFDYYRSGTGPTNVTWQYQVGNGAFNDITNITYPSVSGGATGPTINLAGIGALQNISANTTVTFRIVNYYGASTGTWYIYDNANSTAPDLVVQGTVTQVVSTNPPGFSGFSLAGGNFSLTVTGAVGTSYSILANTNLSSTNWTTLLTTNPGALPFTFVDTNVLPQRFYRVQNP